MVASVGADADEKSEGLDLSLQIGEAIGEEHAAVNVIGSTLVTK